jgi:hypothetical protein
MPSPIILYSANTWLAYHISEKFYLNEHWVWCAPNYDSRSRDSTNPPSSTPGEIYKELREATSRGDRHNTKIASNKVGLLKGATYKRAAGIINDEQLQEINSIIGFAQIIDFRPRMYIIPVTDQVRSIMGEVSIGHRAHPLSVEFIIEKLPRDWFDYIEPY